MQSIVFTGRLAADPAISADGRKATFRLVENRGKDGEGRDRTNAVSCVSWSPARNEKVIRRGLAKGCEATVVGHFVENVYTARDGSQRASKELVVDQLTALDWAEDRAAQRRAA